MKKVIFAVAAFAALTAIDTAPAQAQCRTAFEGGRIVNICSSPIWAPRTPTMAPRCVQRPGFNQPYICR
jgi:hypothetical protein